MNEVYKNKDWLREHYHNQGLSSRECAKLAGCTHTTIERWMESFGIARRTWSEYLQRWWASGLLGSREWRQAQSERVRAALDPSTTGGQARRRFLSEAARKQYDQSTSEGIAAREAQSERNKQMWADGIIGSEGWKSKIAASLRVHYDPTTSKGRAERQRVSIQTRQRWEAGGFDGVFQSPTSIEIAISEALDELGIEHIQQYRPVGCSFTYDEYLPTLGILLEINGNYWHSLPSVPERDARKAAWAREHGYLPVTIWEHEIKKHGAVVMIQDGVRTVIAGIENDA